MQIAVYILTVSVIAAGMIHTISLILRTIAARKIIQIYAPIYNPNEMEYEIRRLLFLYPDTVISIYPSDTARLFRKTYPCISIRTV